MKGQLESVADSYDKGIDLGRQGIDCYQNLPAYLTQHPQFPLFQKMQLEGSFSDSGRKEVVDYLSPAAGMNFVDLGCCLNLMFGSYQDWPSTYYGIDISPKTIELLQDFVEKNHLTVGSLDCGSMHQTPYAESFFEIGACIGSLEYFEKDFVELALSEAHRILKPCAGFVLDIPDIGSPEFEICGLIEAYLGRDDRFNLTLDEFEQLLRPCFEISRKEKIGGMIQYFLTCRK